MEICDALDKLLTEVIDPDFPWRCKFDWILFRCLYESDSTKN